jgi:hypothetical protein
MDSCNNRGKRVWLPTSHLLNPFYICRASFVVANHRQALHPSLPGYVSSSNSSTEPVNLLLLQSTAAPPEMARGAAASLHRDDQDAPVPGESKASKRRCVQSACVPCRKRKSKVSAAGQLAMAKIQWPHVGEERFTSADQLCIVPAILVSSPGPVPHP